MVVGVIVAVAVPLTHVISIFTSMTVLDVAVIAGVTGALSSAATQETAIGLGDQKNGMIAQGLAAAVTAGLAPRFGILPRVSACISTDFRLK